MDWHCLLSRVFSTIGLLFDILGAVVLVRALFVGDYALDSTLQVVYYERMKSGTPFLSTVSITRSSSFFSFFPKNFSASSASVGSASFALAFFLLSGV